jgi:hypothetical protein
VNISLVLSSKVVVEGENPSGLLKDVLACRCFDRCEIPLRNSSGVFYGESRELFENVRDCISVIRDSGVRLLLTVAMHQRDKGLNKQNCAYQATKNGREIVETRMCPRNEFVVSDLREFFQAAFERLELSGLDKVVLSYFRYENILQCVCDRCIEDFSLYMNGKNKKFVYADMESLLHEDVILDWIVWRRNNMIQKSREISGILRGSGIAEVDFDQTKRYLEGVLIEEGLDFGELVSLFSEIYLHIEPVNKNIFMDERKNRVGAYINQLRYLRAISAGAGTKLTPFFWFLNDEKSIERNLGYYYNISREAGFEGISLYTERPLLLAKYLRNGLVF